MRNDRLHDLLDRYFQKIHTPEERSELLKMLEQPENESIVKEWIDKGFSESLPFELDPAAEQDILQAILQVKAPGTGTPLSIRPAIQPAIRPAHRIHFLQKWGWAAASVLVLLIGVSRWLSSRKPVDTTFQTAATRLQNNVMPGGQRATLTLADGTTVSLDSARNGLLARQGGTSIRKLASGQIVYQPSRAASAGNFYNTMSTPRGGQYQLTLPDGTKVWLNAASSIRYPVDFLGAERRVEITGEVYFEVTKDAARPFFVRQAEMKFHKGAMEIRVLGTHFNVNAYEDEGVVRTTLLQGSIQVTAEGKTVLIKPGEQAGLQPAGDISLTHAVDPEQVIAWKSGFFEFHKMDLPTILRQISRWYNVDIRYTRKPGPETFGGRVSKNVRLATVIKGLGITGVTFKMEGNTLVVQP